MSRATKPTPDPVLDALRALDQSRNVTLATIDHVAALADLIRPLWAMWTRSNEEDEAAREFVETYATEAK